MEPAVLIIGNGPYGYCLARKFADKGFSVIITTIEENSLGEIDSLGYYPIYSQNLHEEGCKMVYNQCLAILNNYSLELKYLIHTSRFAFYEFTDEEEPPEDIKIEMDKINSESPLLLAQAFYNTGCQFIFTSSAATKGFSKNLAVHANEGQGNKKIGTRGLKYYSYTKRIGEEKLYAFYKEQNRLDLLRFIYITLMHETNFFKDIGIYNPDMKGWSAEKTANYIAEEILKNNKIDIYPSFDAKLTKILPTFINIKLLDSVKRCRPLNTERSS